MNIVRASGPAAAAVLEGTVVVIDVLRAFTTAAFAFERGARSITLVATAEEAFGLRRERPDLVLVGEIDGEPIRGFDHGNSPEEIDGVDLRRRDLVLRSTAGTQGAVRASRASRLYVASLVVAAATVRAVGRHGGTISLLAMNSPLGADELEDEACADLMEAHLLGRALDHAHVRARVLASPAAARAIDPQIAWIRAGDLDRALQIDRFDFAMPVTREAGQLVVMRENC